MFIHCIFILAGISSSSDAATTSKLANQLAQKRQYTGKRSNPTDHSTTATKTIDSFVVRPLEPGPTPLNKKRKQDEANTKAERGANTHNHHHSAITFSQIDTQVLKELPQEVQDELLESLRPSFGMFFGRKKRQRQGDGGGDRAVEVEVTDVVMRMDGVMMGGDAMAHGNGSASQKQEEENIIRSCESVKRLVEGSVNAHEHALFDAIVEAIDEFMYDMGGSSDVEGEEDAGNNNSATTARRKKKVDAFAAILCRASLPLISRDLETTKRVLTYLHKRKHDVMMCDVIIDAIQSRVQQRYNHRLAL